MDRRNFGEAASCFEEALTLLRRAGEEGVVPVVQVWLETVALIQGDQDRAVLMFEEGLAQARSRSDRLGTYNALYNLAQVALSRGDHELAIRMLKEGIILSGQIGDQANLSYFLEGLAVVTGVQGDAERSARLLGAAERLLEEAGASVYNYHKPDRSLYEQTTTSVRSRLGEEGFEELTQRSSREEGGGPLCGMLKSKAAGSISLQAADIMNSWRCLDVTLCSRPPRKHLLKRSEKGRRRLRCSPTGYGRFFWPIYVLRIMAKPTRGALLVPLFGQHLYKACATRTHKN
jgi:hypothetical protein